MTDYSNAAAEPDDDGSPTSARNWPDLSPAVFQGVCGQIVNKVMPYTEADPAAVTATLLASVGCMAGGKRYALAGNDQHPARLWPLVCGRTSDGAKGTSWSVVKTLISSAKVGFLDDHLEGGIVTGEGLIELVRDESGDEGDFKNYDPGVTDKRLLLIESEYASVLSKGARQGSSLMQVQREAWDGSTLRSAARKSNKLRATAPHITLVGHVTPGELRSKLTAGEVDGGTINRLLIVLSRRSKELPDGGNLPDKVRDDCGELIRDALDAIVDGRIHRAESANELWRKNYSRLIAPKPDGWFASATARAHAQVLRLSVAYAILDRSTVITVDHLTAALALWQYAEDSAKFLFADLGYDTQNDDASRVLDFIAQHGEVSRTDLCNRLFKKHKKSYEVDAILKPLIESGQVAQQTIETDGRSKTVYTLRKMRKKRHKEPDQGEQPKNDCGESAEKGAEEAVTADDGGLFRTSSADDSERKSQVSGHSPHSPHSPHKEEVCACGGKLLHWDSFVNGQCEACRMATARSASWPSTAARPGPIHKKGRTP